MSLKEQTYAEKIREAVADHYFDAGKQSELHQDLMNRMTPNEKQDFIDSEQERKQTKQDIYNAIIRERDELLQQQLQETINQYQKEKDIYEEELKDILGIFEIDYYADYDSTKNEKIITISDSKKAFTREYFNDMSFVIFEISDENQNKYFNINEHIEQDEQHNNSTVVAQQRELLQLYTDNMNIFVFLVNIPYNVKQTNQMLSTTYNTYAIVIAPTNDISYYLKSQKLNVLSVTLSEISEQAQENINDKLSELQETEEIDIEFFKKFGNFNADVAWSIQDIPPEMAPKLIYDNLVSSVKPLKIKANGRIDDNSSINDESNFINAIPQEEYDKIEIPF